MNTQAIQAMLNNVVVTVIDQSKKGCVKIQLSDGTVKSVRPKEVTIMNNAQTTTQVEIPEMDYNNLDLDFDTIFGGTTAKFEQDLLEANADFISKCISDIEEASALAQKEELSYLVARGLGFINAVRVLQEMTKDTLEYTQVTRAILESTRNFNRKAEPRAELEFTKVANYNKTISGYIRDGLQYYSVMNNLGESLVATFDWGVENITKKFRILTDEEIIGSKYYSNKNCDLAYVPAITDQPVLVTVRNGAVVLTAKAKTVMQYANGTSFELPVDRSVGITAKDVKSGIVSIMDRVFFHNESVFTDDNGKEHVVYNENPTTILGSIFNKIFMVKSNKINLDKLLEDTAEIKQKVVAIKPTGKLEDLAYPAHKLFNTYGLLSGMVSLQEAKSGYLVKVQNVSALIEFKASMAYSIETINKAIARADKQEKSNGWAAGNFRMFVTYSFDNAPKAEKILGTGAAILGEEFFDRYMLARVTSRMFKGGVKAATQFDKEFTETYKGGLIGPSAFKGGFVGLLSLMGKTLPLATFGSDNEVGQNYLEEIREYAEAGLQEVVFQGETLKGYWVNIPLQITNTVGIEQYKWTEEVDTDSLMERASNLADVEATPNGLRDYVMDLAINDPSFSSVDFIMSGLEEGTIEEKKTYTRYSTSLFQSMVMWHGHKHVTKLIRSLVNNMPKGKGAKVLASQFLTANYKTINTVHASQIANLLMDHAEESGMALMEDVATYPVELCNKLLDLFKWDAESKSAEWVKVNFNGVNIHVPTHSAFYNVNAEIKYGRSFVAIGFMRELLESVKKAIVPTISESGSVTYTLNHNSLQGEAKFMQAKIQAKLLGKSFGHIYTDGAYQLMLPSYNANLAVHEVEVTDASVFLPYDEEGNKRTVLAGEVLALNGVKYPAYFEDAAAGYNMIQISTGSAIVDFAMRKAVFMNPETIMIMQNDCDGDLHQFTNDGYQLPLFRGPRGQFNEKSFIQFLEDERVGNTLRKSRTVSSTTMKDFQEAIFEAGSAKDNIGKYTATKYVYETLLEGVTDFLSTKGNIVEVNGKFRHHVISTLAYLCQVEAMDKVKQDGQVVLNIMDLVSPHMLNSFKDFGTKTAAQLRDEAIKSLTKRLEAFFTKEGWNVEKAFATNMVEALHYVAMVKKSNTMDAYNIFNDRAVGEKRFNAIKEELSTGTKAEESFNYEGSYSTAVSGIDSASMYNHVLKTLVRAFGPEYI